MNIFQSHEWEEFKQKTGYQKSYRVDGILVLQKNLPLGYSMLYSPMVGGEDAARIKNNELGAAQRAGLVPTESPDGVCPAGIKDFLGQIRKLAQENNAIFYRLELDIPQTTDYKLPTGFGFTKAFEEMQPEHTLILDLTKTEQEILAQMKQKGRYNIKIAEQNGILIEKTDKVDEFYNIYSRTAKRHGITYRGKSYFEGLLEILGQKGYARLYTAGKKIGGNGTVLAAAIMVYSDDTAIYMFGASNDEHRNLMAPYLLHWQMIRDAKAEGYKKYDFFGIAPDDNEKHPWAGVTRFKKQFGGEQVDLMGSYDLIFKPVMYQLFKIAEKIRR